MSSVIDLASRRYRPSPAVEIVHPAGVRVPFDEPAFAEFLIPEIRGDIGSGVYGANLIRQIPDTVSRGDRALVIGAGLGIISSLVAKTGKPDRVLAVEADPRLIPCLKRVHTVNGAAWAETVHGVLSTKATGLTAFFPHRDFRASSLLPNSRTDIPVLVPCLDVNLILEDEQINLIICDLPNAPTRLLADANLDRVERILIDCSATKNARPNRTEFTNLMFQRGFSAKPGDDVMFFERKGRSRFDILKGRRWENEASGF